MKSNLKLVGEEQQVKSQSMMDSLMSFSKVIYKAHYTYFIFICMHIHYNTLLWGFS